MTRFASALGAALLTAAVTPALAAAAQVQLGVTASPIVAPTCPAGLPASQCDIVLAQSTALATMRDGVAYPTRVKQAGEVVSFTVGIAALSSNAAQRRTYVSGLNTRWGGAPSLELTVLRPVGSASHFRWSVAGQSRPVNLTRFLGRIVEFPLNASIPVVPGEVVALTSPTWAPVLSIQQPTAKFAYRQSRRASCTGLSSMQQMTVIGQRATFGCAYAGTRVEYAASEILSPS
jgi:hypothetical protein